MLVALERESLLEDLAARVGLAEREIDEIELRGKGQRHESVSEQMDEEASKRLRLPADDMAHGAHGEAVLLGQVSLHKEEYQRYEDCDDRYGRGEVVVGSHLTYILVVDDDRESGVALSYHQRRAEVRYRPHEDHQGSSQN